MRDKKKLNLLKSMARGERESDVNWLNKFRIVKRGKRESRREKKGLEGKNTWESFTVEKKWILILGFIWKASFFLFLNLHLCRSRLVIIAPHSHVRHKEVQNAVVSVRHWNAVVFVNLPSPFLFLSLQLKTEKDYSVCSLQGVRDKANHRPTLTELLD